MLDFTVIFLNFSLKLIDLIANLEWIQKEIDKFGGDPKRVTFMGYSSGATAIQYILSSPKLQNRRLFDRVLLSSGNPIMAPGLSWNISHMLLNITNCSRSSNLTLSIREKLKCLRSLSAEELNVKTGELKEYWEHLKPQSSKSLLPARSYGELAKKRKVGIKNM
jgi:carboxylesterase type B